MEAPQDAEQLELDESYVLAREDALRELAQVRRRERPLLLDLRREEEAAHAHELEIEGRAGFLREVAEESVAAAIPT